VSRSFLFLQGPTNLLFAKVAARLRAAGDEAWRVHVCLGDEVFWRGPNAVPFRGRAAQWPEWIDAFYSQHGITDVVLLGEKRQLQRVAIDSAGRRGIEVTVTDFGYRRPDWIVVERDGLNGGSRFPRDPDAIHALAQGLPQGNSAVRFPHRPARQAVMDMTFNLSSALVPWAYPHFERHTLRHPIVNYAATGLRLARGGAEARHARSVCAALEGRRYFLFAMQMEDDFSLRAYSNFPGMPAAMAAALGSFTIHAPADAHIVFKLHPLDPGLRDWRRVVTQLAREHDVEGRVHFIDGGDLDALLRLSAGLASVNSTTGVRAIELGVPTLVLGEAVYRIAGLVHEDVGEAFWRMEAKPDVALADAFTRALTATVHVRGSMYDPAGIEAAADAMAYRLHHGLVNVPLGSVLTGEALSLGGQ
jgi:capsular polysaccharide export protein